MKITEISKEYLEKGGLIRRKGWMEDISISFNKSASIFDAYINGIITGDKTDLTLEDIISDDWELIEKSTQVWQPQYDEKYYYITTSGDVAYNTFNTSLDEYRLSFRNVFKTAEEARKMVEKLKIINKLRELSNIKFNDDCKKEHYVISYNNESKKIVCDVHHLFVREIPFNIYFKTEEDCKKAIETIGEDNLKKYYFDIKEEK